MKTTATLFVFTLFLNLSFSQNLHITFDDWEPSPPGCDVPSGWLLEPWCESLEMISHNGNTGAKLTSNQPTIEGPWPGVLKMPLDKAPAKVIFTARCDSVAGPCWIYIIGKKIEPPHYWRYAGEWITTTQMADFETLEFEVIQDTAALLYDLELVVSASAFGPVGSDGYAELSILDLWLDFTTSTEEAHQKPLKFNNPVSEILTIEGDGIEMVEVFSMNGKKLFKVQPHSLAGNNSLEIPFPGVAAGTFLLRVVQDGRAVFHKVVKI